MSERSKKYHSRMREIQRREVSDELFKQVADEFDIPVSKVKEIIVGGQSKFTAHIIRQGAFDGVRWKWLGKFTAKTDTAKILKHLKGISPEQKEFFTARLMHQKNKKKDG